VKRLEYFKYANKKIQAELKGGALVQKSINNVSNFVQSPSSTCNYGWNIDRF